jgi:5'-nucleotidase
MTSHHPLSYNIAGIFSQCSQLPSGYKEQDAALCQRYRPIEIDPNISREEKAKHMVDWYQEAQKLLCGFDFRTEELEEVIRREGAELRYICLYMFLLTVCTLSGPSKHTSLFLFIIY